jgi:hypothetical protein
LLLCGDGGGGGGGSGSSSSSSSSSSTASSNLLRHEHTIETTSIQLKQEKKNKEKNYIICNLHNYFVQETITP